MKEWDAIWINANIVTCASNENDIKRGAIAVKNGMIDWIGEMAALPKHPNAKVIYDLKGAYLTPGFIDCHTHLIFGGNRAHEFEKRLKGATYEEISASGGGIQSTVEATRVLSEEKLLHDSLLRAKYLMQSGVTTIEIKSGYGLNLETELKILRVAKQMQSLLPLTIYKTFLGAHSIPKEYINRADDYVDYVCQEMIPAIVEENLADAVDVFCESIAFNLPQTEKIFETAVAYGLQIKCHSEQLSSSESAKLAAKFAAISVDHLEFVSEESIKAMAMSGTVAVLLPGAFYFLGEQKLPPISLLREYNIPIAIATDCNPGTSPMLSILLAMNMGATLFRLTPQETLQGVTHHAARALGIDNRGMLAVDMAADFAIWNVYDPNELTYFFGYSPLIQLVKDGVVVYENEI